MKDLKDNLVIKVYNTKCDQCLFTKDRIVSSERTKDIIMDCLRNQKYFICHKSTIQGKEIMCKGFYDKFKNTLLLLKLGNELDLLEFVDQDKPE